MVQALEAAHARDIARAQHPTGRLSAMPAELLEGHTATSCCGRGSGAKGQLSELGFPARHLSLAVTRQVT